MAHKVGVETVAPHSLAAVRRSVRIGEVGKAWGPALDLVWAYLKRHPELTPGCNIFLYRHPARWNEPMEVDFGVAVSGPFAPEGEIIRAETPAGEAATTLHVGPYDQIRAAHDAIHAWRAANNRTFAGWSWEIYGDWTDDPAKLETRIFYLLR